MAKPIISNPVLKGKVAKEFSKIFLSKEVPSPERAKQNKKDIGVFLSTKVR